MGRAHFVVDVFAIGRDAYGRNLCTQFPNGRRRNLIGGTIGAIEHDMQAIKADMVRHRQFGCINIATTRVLDTACAANIVRRCKIGRLFNQRLDR